VTIYYNNIKCNTPQTKNSKIFESEISGLNKKTLKKQKDIEKTKRH
jgi:hypothetical protein